MKQPSNVPQVKKDSEMPFGMKNYILLVAGILFIVVGFWIMSMYKFSDAVNSPPDLTIAPVVIIAGYALIVFAIMAKSGNEEKDQAS